MTSDDPAESLAELGEFAVIDRLVAGRHQADSVEVGPGDDAAVVRAADSRVVVSTDMLVEGIHFRRDWSSPHDIGRKAIAANAADVEAMGASTTAFVVSFGAPGDTQAAHALELADGMWDEAGRFGAGIVGGDLVSAPQWVISVTALGDLGGRAAVRLDGAKAGDTVAMVGDIGWSAGGYALLANGVDGFEELRRRHLAPKPPYGQGWVAADAGASSMTDVSDGLVADLGHIADASGVGIDISTASLSGHCDALRPAADEVAMDPWAWVLAGGEDHALVATFPGPPPVGWRVIGSVLEGPPRVLVDGAHWGGNAGWESFD
jgi:thiamine-monophosphate kinase